MKTAKISLIFLAVSALGACTATSSSSNGLPSSGANTQASQSALTSPHPRQTITQTETLDQPNQQVAVSLSLEQIMSDPDWLGRQPENPAFSPGGVYITYARKQEGSINRDLFITNAGYGNGNKASLATIHQYNYDEYIDDKDFDYFAWIFEGDVFAQKRGSDEVIQLTRDTAQAKNLAYYQNNSQENGVSFQVGNSFYAIDVDSGRFKQVLSWEFAEKPQAVKAPEDYLAQEQLKLIEYENVQRKNRQDRENLQNALKQANDAVMSAEFYFNKDHTNVLASLSPDGRYAIIVTRENKPSRSDSDIMPDYIEESGRIVAQAVRQRVADAQPVSHDIHLVNIQTGESHQISYNNLPGYNEDVLEAEKRENAEARGETYETNRLPRDIGLLFDWYATEMPIRWHDNGEVVALMLEAWDNKDRWIVTLDPDGDKRFVTQHRMHDDAWVNYRFNQFGWLEDSETLYLLSEESGYSHLYLKPLDGSLKQITSGRYVVDDVYISRDDKYAFYKANKKHPGIYEIYRSDLASGESMALTDLNGMTDFIMSPEEDELLLTHSKLTMPPELYTLQLDANAAAQGLSPERLTDTVSDAFLSIDWKAPSIVAIESSHTEQPIYSRVYLPEESAGEAGQKRRAVVFNHGAGYLQNAHMGWSNYFREFMFHNLLIDQGYVVLDMDFRASAGYGRDWRTAIYRQMGTPEVQDLRDGVNWLVENANVDRERIGTYGGSYGGFLTFMALFNEPDLFQAGAALRPVSDWAHYNTPYTSNILNTPSVDPLAYERSSPIYFAEGLEKPLLINAPMVDDNVFFVDVVRLVQRLIELEKEDFETAIYPVEPHGFVQPSSWLDEYRRIYKLFETNL
uniref:S9 family peptidase n=1 Tax=Ningiella ruwaisensis TaxID=2364274 RepID=UPI0010A059D2|nr:prolyl oligopeptidase family serine peptidase [Ningiella ruwaisensis]